MNTPVHRLSAALAGLLVAATVAACGDADAAPTKEAYLENANSICLELNQERERLVAASFPVVDRPPTVAELQTFAVAFGPIFHSKLDALLRALDTPEGDQDTVEAMYDAADRIADGIDQLATDHDVAARMIETDEDVPGADEADRLAADYGLTKCADGSTE